jgi:hypothetical protein
VRIWTRKSELEVVTRRSGLTGVADGSASVDDGVVAVVATTAGGAA